MPALPPSSTRPVLVLGAGLTGLSTAFHLARERIPHRIVERLDHVGGHAITIDDEGFRFDRTGHLLHLRDPELRQLVLDWLGGDVVEVQRRSWIYSHGVFTRYPFQANTFGLPPEVAHECVMGFLNAREQTHDRPAANFEEYCLRHFGAGFSKHFMIPYNARLWGVAPSEITTAWCDRFVPVPKLEDVIAGAVGLNDRELGYNTSFLYPRSGIGALPTAMARGLDVELRTAPIGIDWREKIVRFADGPQPYATLVSTMPLDALGRLMGEIPAEIAEAFRRLRCNDLCYLDVALRRPPPRPFHWIYVPEERFPFYRVGCYSSFSSALVPEGRASLYVELVDRSPSFESVMPSVLEGLTTMGIIERDDDVLFARLRRIDHAYVIYDHAYVDAVTLLTQFLESQGILSVGRYGGWNYSSMEDALRFGRDAARSIQPAS